MNFIKGASSMTHSDSEGPHPSDNKAFTLAGQNRLRVLTYIPKPFTTPLHRVTSTAKGKGFIGPVQWRRECEIVI